jgi:hypothetical protein
MPGYQVKDASHEKTFALPNGAAVTQGAGIDTMNSTRGDFSNPHELVVDAPALTTGELGDGQTIVYTVEHDTASGFGTVATLYTLGTQTGAGGAGSAAAQYKVKLPTNVKRYVRVKATKTGASNASTKSATYGLRF